ncbi:hypothetical protein OXPF_02230 [Oxobacter pfennigii]|uniref:Uncharacterized protein n=1 Tax=Oxobacter pfennigii TaxID=36849 RepID=A0A0P9AL76_9CLOT|nr:hypothetical protein [Oxobacter pfennigii]KPU46113.1 hypothetical protein OXPF_02230 [Oxobacter pfennigii]
MSNCKTCKYFLEKGKVCEFARYGYMVNEAKSSMETPCSDGEYLDYILKKN